MKIVDLARGYARLRAALPSAARHEKRELKRLLFLGYAAVGDLIFLLPALKALRDGLPRTKITFVGDDDTGTRELLPGTKLVDEIWRYPHARLAEESIHAELAERFAGFDAVIVSQGTPLRPFARAILQIPDRVGHWRPIEAPGKPLTWLKRWTIHSELERRWTLNKPVWTPEQTEHVVARNLKLAAEAGVAVRSPSETRPRLPTTDAAEAFAAAMLPPDKHKTVGLHLGSPKTQFDRLWPMERWAHVARELKERRGCRIALFGGPDEVPTVEPFRAALNRSFVDLVGKGSLLDSFAAIKRCDVFLSSDTGPAKAAMALGVPTATVWGPTSPVDHGIVWEPERHLDISAGVSCSPCVLMSLRKEGRGVLNHSNCGHHDCMATLSAETVLAKIDARYGPALALA